MKSEPNDQIPFAEKEENSKEENPQCDEIEKEELTELDYDPSDVGSDSGCETMPDLDDFLLRLYGKHPEIIIFDKKLKSDIEEEIVLGTYFTREKKDQL